MERDFNQMTTPPAPENGAALTMPQAIMLRTACEDGYIPTSYSDSQSDDKYKAILSLVELGLLKQSLDHFVVPTAKGRAVLAAQSAGEKPETISAKDFVEQKYHEKIKRGECTVTELENPDDIVVDIILRPSGDMQLWYDDQATDYITKPDDLFTVTWLPATVQPVPVGGEASQELSIVCHTLDDEMVHMLQGYGVSRHDIIVLDNKLWHDFQTRNDLRIDNEHLSAQLAALEANQQAAAGLVEALKQISDNAPNSFPLERDFKNSGSHGVAFGHYNMAVIARIALATYEALAVLAATGQPADGDGNG